MPQCSLCGEKDRDKFYESNQNRNSALCVKCSKERNAANRQKPEQRARAIERVNRWREENREWYLEARRDREKRNREKQAEIRNLLKEARKNGQTVEQVRDEIARRDSARIREG